MGPRYAALPSTIPVEPFSPPFHLTLHRFLFKSLPLVKELLSLCESQIHLDPSVYKVKLDWNQRISLLIHFADEPSDLPFMKEELPCPQGGMIHSVGLGIRADMRVDEKDLTPFNIAVTIAQVDLSVP